MPAMSQDVPQAYVEKLGLGVRALCIHAELDRPETYCAEQIQAQAVLCRFCGRDQVDKNAEVIRFDGSPSHSAYFGEYVLYGLLSLLVIGLRGLPEPLALYEWLKSQIETARREHRVMSVDQ